MSIKSLNNSTGISTKNIELADVLAKCIDQYKSKFKLTSHHQRVVNDIIHCRDGTFGYHLNVCDSCFYVEKGFNSCKNRHCPKCSGATRNNWAKKMLSNILPVPYFHVVFTLPHCIHPLSLFNKTLFYELLFKSSSDTLNAFAADPKWLGAKLGFYGVLHTWGGKLNQHLHVHYIIPGGGLTNSGEWKSVKYKTKFIFPVKALSKVFRGKFIDCLKKANINNLIQFPGELSKYKPESEFENWIDNTFNKKWVVFAKRPFSKPDKVIKYLSMYSHRVSLSNNRLIKLDDNKVFFNYKSYDKKRDKLTWHKTSLEKNDFIKRFLIHIMPSGFHRIRHYGIFANGKCASNINIIRNYLGSKKEEFKQKKFSKMKCPNCTKGNMVTILIKIINPFSYFRKTIFLQNRVHLLFDTL